ncbi:nuclear transport factor 2 family protein [Flavobacterium hydrophilum]|uniref:Nuclear transport factor 2 family protein n=1 Tax=Flavobacterium hydrophilum TaxID=2211445 RepID=A0A2V4CKW6_9FLAO|nr:nuclear transport factor 2 family protein [Flavobacterium hydrophilum]PXY46414.1 nuclear transport factor 2 family protein [Flavobacterium hydrophilum]
MKLLLTAFMLCIFQGIKAQNTIKMENQKEEVLAITNAIEDQYFKGIYEGDEALLGSVFHAEALLFGDVKGEPYFKTIALYLEGVKNRQSPKDSGKPFKGEILNIKVVNSIAVAELNVKMYDFNYRDFLSFHKINGKWLIVNKMLTDISE